MTTFVIAAGDSLYLIRPGERLIAERHLSGSSPEALAADGANPSRLLAGTREGGLWRSPDAGRTWDPVGKGIPHSGITAVGVGAGSGSSPSPIYAGTDPSSLSRSDDGGDSWRHLPGLLELPSASSWSFPPTPETHHVRWIGADPVSPEKIFVAIEAGALVRSPDGGDTWFDREDGGPIDTHSAVMPPAKPGRLYSAAGDGFFVTSDGGATWSRVTSGLRHGYLVGVAVDSGDPETVVVSASRGPYQAYWPAEAEAFVYRKAGRRFELAMEGLPAPGGTVASRLASDPKRAGVFYAANNHGLFFSEDAGERWARMDIEWPSGALSRGLTALLTVPSSDSGSSPG